ncbi:GNAT family protein [soil metagenome]
MLQRRYDVRLWVQASFLTWEPRVELHDPDPELHDDGVRLRRWQAHDLPCVRAVSAEGQIPHGTTVPVTFTEQSGLAFIERQHGRTRDGEGWSLAIVDAVTGQAVGCIVLMLRPQGGVAGLGYWLIPTARGMGYASRAARLLSDWGLATAGLARIEAWVEPDNQASVRVLDRCGFEYEGRLRSFLAFAAQRSDALVFSRIRGTSSD